MIAGLVPIMAQSKPITGGKKLARAVSVRPATLDDLSSIRYLHATAFRLQADDYFTSDEIEQFRQLVYSPAYADAVVAAHLSTAWIGTELAGTAGWAPQPGRQSLALIRFVFVRPPFARLGVARRLVAEAEQSARAAGLERLAVDCPANAVTIFTRLGYRPATLPSKSTTGDLGLPVRRMVKIHDAPPVA